MMYQVLIADGERLMREALRAMVSKVDGFHVAGCACSGKEAVDICTGTEIDIVFMDVMIPGISGIAAGKAIHALNPSIAIYIISAYNNFEFVREALSVKIRDYISKPVSFSIIARLLDDYERDHCVRESRLSLLTGMLEQCRYDRIHTVVPEIVQDVFLRDAHDPDGIRRRFIQMGQSLLRMIDPVGSRSVDVEEQFPPNDVFDNKSIFWTFWLFDIMDYAFRRIAVLKCEHLQSVFGYIDKNIKQNISLGRICESCNISQGYLSRRFKQYLGVSVMEYIHLRKIKHAKMYVAYTDLNMADIAYHLDYNEGSYFTKVFKKYEGITPQQYRSKIMSV
jgi:two-component system response regulator YesN